MFRNTTLLADDIFTIKTSRVDFRSPACVAGQIVKLDGRPDTPQEFDLTRLILLVRGKAIFRR